MDLRAGRVDPLRERPGVNTYEHGTQRLATTSVDREDQPGVDQHVTFRCDEVGNVASLADVSHTGTGNQCFAYDHLRRLAEARTQGDRTCAPLRRRSKSAARPRTGIRSPATRPATEAPSYVKEYGWGAGAVELSKDIVDPFGFHEASEPPRTSGGACPPESCA